MSVQARAEVSRQTGERRGSRRSFEGALLGTLDLLLAGMAYSPSINATNSASAATFSSGPVVTS